jgi:hypothetical protein
MLSYLPVIAALRRWQAGDPNLVNYTTICYANENDEY